MEKRDLLFLLQEPEEIVLDGYNLEKRTLAFFSFALILYLMKILATSITITCIATAIATCGAVQEAHIMIFSQKEQKKTHSYHQPILPFHRIHAKYLVVDERNISARYKQGDR